MSYFTFIKKIVIKVMSMKRKLVLFLVFQMWTQSWFLWIVIVEVAGTVGDAYTGDDSKPKSYDNTGNSTTVEKINNTIQSPIHIKHSEEESSTHVYYIYYNTFLA